jgi:hypothetical protein
MLNKRTTCMHGLGGAARPAVRVPTHWRGAGRRPPAQHHCPGPLQLSRGGWSESSEAHGMAVPCSSAAGAQLPHATAPGGRGALGHWRVGLPSWVRGGRLGICEPSLRAASLAGTGSDAGIGTRPGVAGSCWRSGAARREVGVLGWADTGIASGNQGLFPIVCSRTEVAACVACCMLPHADGRPRMTAPRVLDTPSGACGGRECLPSLPALPLLPLSPVAIFSGPLVLGTIRHDPARSGRDQSSCDVALERRDRCVRCRLYGPLLSSPCGYIRLLRPTPSWTCVHGGTASVVVGVGPGAGPVGSPGCGTHSQRASHTAQVHVLAPHHPMELPSGCVNNPAASSDGQQHPQTHLPRFGAVSRSSTRRPTGILSAVHMVGSVAQVMAVP